MRKLNVVYFGIPTGPVEWYQPIREAIAAQHHLTSYDPNSVFSNPFLDTLFG